MSLNVKQDAKDIIKERNLRRRVNNAKWKQLQESVLQEMPFPPNFLRKTIFETKCQQDIKVLYDISRLGSWYDVFMYRSNPRSYFVVEWLKVNPRYLYQRWLLLPPYIIDASAQFEEILKRLEIPYEIENGMYCIYGYKEARKRSARSCGKQ